MVRLLRWSPNRRAPGTVTPRRQPPWKRRGHDLRAARGRVRIAASSLEYVIQADGEHLPRRRAQRVDEALDLLPVAGERPPRTVPTHCAGM